MALLFKKLEQDFIQARIGIVKDTAPDVSLWKQTTYYKKTLNPPKYYTSDDLPSGLVYRAPSAKKFKANPSAPPSTYMSGFLSNLQQRANNLLNDQASNGAPSNQVVLPNQNEQQALAQPNQNEQPVSQQENADGKNQSSAFVEDLDLVKARDYNTDLSKWGFAPGFEIKEERAPNKGETDIQNDINYWRGLYDRAGKLKNFPLPLEGDTPLSFRNRIAEFALFVLSEDEFNALKQEYNDLVDYIRLIDKDTKMINIREGKSSTRPKALGQLLKYVDSRISNRFPKIIEDKLKELRSAINDKKNADSETQLERFNKGIADLVLPFKPTGDSKSLVAELVKKPPPSVYEKKKKSSQNAAAAAVSATEPVETTALPPLIPTPPRSRVESKSNPPSKPSSRASSQGSSRSTPVENFVKTLSDRLARSSSSRAPSRASSQASKRSSNVEFS